MSADLNAALAELRAWEAADERGNLLVAELLDAIPEGAVLVAIQWSDFTTREDGKAPYLMSAGVWNRIEQEAWAALEAQS